MLIVLIFKLFVMFNVVCVAYGATNLDADLVEPHYNLRTRDKREHSLHEESTTPLQLQQSLIQSEQELQRKNLR